MSYTALYRKFRPDNFDDVKGQEHIVTTLKNEIRTGRIGHAYLFCGTRGTGKTTIAKILAKAVNCEHTADGSPCNECSMCQKISRHTSMNVAEIDAASNNGVANIRDIIDEVQYSPTEGRYKVYIIDEVHMLSSGAFNALLKTLEEPPPYVIFILATTESHKIPITILSRCQRYDFKRISVDIIASRLKELTEQEGVYAEEEALRYIAKAADGSMRDALSLLDRCIAFYLGQKLTYDNTLDVLGAVDTGVYSEMFCYIVKFDAMGCIKLIDNMMVLGRDLGQFITEFIWYLRNLLIINSSADGARIVDVSLEQLAALEENAKKTDTDTLVRYVKVLSELLEQIRYASQKRVLVEVCFIKLCKPQMDTEQDMSSVIARITALEKKIEKYAATTCVESLKEIPTVDSAKKEEYKISPEVIPADIEEVVKRWQEVIDQCSMVEQSMLSNVKKIVSDDGELILQFTDPVEEGYFKQEEGRQLEALKTIIKNITNMDIDIQTRTVTEETDKHFDDLSQIIHFDNIEYV